MLPNYFFHIYYICAVGCFPLVFKRKISDGKGEKMIAQQVPETHKLNKFHVRS